MSDIDVLDLPVRNPLFSGDIFDANIVGNAGVDTVADGPSIWSDLSDLVSGIGGVVGTGFDVYGDYQENKAELYALKHPQMSTQTMLLIGGIGVLVLVLLLRK